MFENPGNFQVYSVGSSRYCHIYFVHNPQQIRNSWTCFHEKEEALRAKCPICVALLVSEQNKRARSPSAEKIKHQEALDLPLLPRLAFLMGSVCSHAPFFVCSLLFHRNPWKHMPQPPSRVSWVGISVDAAISFQKGMCVRHMSAFN